MRSLRSLSPSERLDAIAGGDAQPLPPPGASPYLARYGIETRDDDGVIAALGRVAGEPALVVAQDERFLRGSVGARHAQALRATFERARDERRPVVLLLASGGVRLHEANAAEIALAQALRSMLDARADGIVVLGIAAGDVFGGASVLACACDRLALLPGTRLGLSGPKVIETARGRDELDASDAAAVEDLFGARARAQRGVADLVADDLEAIHAWIANALRDAIAFPLRVLAIHERLHARWNEAHRDLAERPWIESDPDRGLLWMRAARAAFGPGQALAADASLLAADDADLDRPRTLAIVEDSSGHPPTREAEALGVSQYLAHHAAVLALLRSRGHRVVGWLDGVGHSAAFFANALQADALYASSRSRVVAMTPEAIARITGLDAARLAGAIRDDELLGQPVRHFAALGGVAGFAESAQALAELIASPR